MKTHRLIRSSSRNLLHNNEGVTLIEFAIVIPTFLLLLMSAIELGLIHYASSTVDVLGSQVSRYSKTGYDYSGGQTYNYASGEDSAFDGQTGGNHFTMDADGNVQMRGREGFIREWLKDNGNAILDPEKLTLETRIFEDMSQAKFNGDADKPYSMGAGGQAVAYTVKYEWDILTPLLMPFFGTTHYIQSTAVSQNELFN